MVAASLLVATVISISFAVEASRQRDVASDQRDVAEIAKQEADQQRAEAEQAKWLGGHLPAPLLHSPLSSLRHTRISVVHHIEVAVVM